MYDREDFIYKEYKSKQRKNGFAKVKLYRIICDTCGEKQGYAAIDNKKNYCKKCQYTKLSNIFSQPKIIVSCAVCGREMSYCQSQYDRAKVHYCSKECIGISKRKDIIDVKRSHLRIKMLQLGVEPICVTCGHDHVWNLQAHHKIFVMHGGDNSLENLEFQCRNCHADIHNEKGEDIDE